jgi:hypothetical protein
VLATAAIGAGGSLKFALANIAPGTYTCTLVYAGDAAHTAGTSAAFTLKINKAKTSVVLTTNPASALSGQDVVLSAFVKAATGGSTARTGNVIFKDNGVTIATVAVDGTSTAAFTDVAPDTGAHKYTAEYEGDDNFLAGPAVSKSVTVKKNKVTGVLAADLPNPVALNTDVEFTLQLTVVAPGTTTPTGNVTFKDGATILGTVALDGSGLATLSNIQFTTAGTHKITATYVGDLNTFNFTSTSLSVITA